jgi:hypothetical protein
VIVFPVPLAKELREEYVTYVPEKEARKPGSQRSAAIKAACGETGTLGAPTAKPGHLCAYGELEDFRDRTLSGGIPTHHGTSTPFVDGEFMGIVNHFPSPGADATGARVAFGVLDIRTPEEEAEGAYPHIIARGSWAVTAP